VRTSSPAVSGSLPSRLLFAAIVAALASSSAGCYRSRLLKPKVCPEDDPTCKAPADKTDAAADGLGGATTDGKRDGTAEARTDGPRDNAAGVRDGRRDAAGDGKRDGATDGKRDSRRDSYACGPVEICGNGDDDDCNGYADCKDVACMSEPSCITHKKETCDNGIDDDGNGLVDCEDPACSGDKACATPGIEVCNNNLDDDEDGLVDCADPDCSDDPTCEVTPGDEICDNGEDDNGDGLSDCTDPKCKTFPACLQADCTPDVDFGPIASSGASQTRTMTTTGSQKRYATCASGVASVGSFSLAAAADVKLDLSQSKGSAHVVALFRAGVGQACDQNPVSYECLDAGTEETATTTYNALSPGSYWVIVQSYPGTPGTTSVTLSTGSIGTVEQCNNGIDDDNDGAMDCADLDCATSSTCNLCVPDIDLGTIALGADEKMTTFDTNEGQDRYHPMAAGLSSGNDIVVRFSVKETVGITLKTWQHSGDHVYGIFAMPQAGDRCDAREIGDDGVDLHGDYYSKMNWHDFDPADYLLIFKAKSADEEGSMEVSLSAFPNRKEELCTNGIDDNGDLLVDCDDPTCYSLPICQAPMCIPDDDLGDLDDGDMVTHEVDLTTATQIHAADCAKGDGHGRAYRINLLTAMNLGVRCTQSGDHVLQLAPQTSPLDACDSNMKGCFDPQRSTYGCNFTWPSLQPGVYNILVDAFTSGSEGTVRLTLRGSKQTVEEDCGNGKDDDNDGATDCEDRKCAGDDRCANLRCRPDKALGLLPLDGSTLSTAVATSDADDDQQKTACVSGPGGEDEVVGFELPGDTDLAIEWAQVGDHVLALYRADTLPLPCEANQLVDCHVTAGATTGNFSLNKLAAGKYYMVVDADKAGSEGGVILQISGKTAAP